MVKLQRALNKSASKCEVCMQSPTLYSTSLTMLDIIFTFSLARSSASFSESVLASWGLNMNAAVAKGADGLTHSRRLHAKNRIKFVRPEVEGPEAERPSL